MELACPRHASANGFADEDEQISTTHVRFGRVNLSPCGHRQLRSSRFALFSLGITLSLAASKKDPDNVSGGCFCVCFSILLGTSGFPHLRCVPTSRSVQLRRHEMQEQVVRRSRVHLLVCSPSASEEQGCQIFFGESSFYQRVTNVHRITFCLRFFFQLQDSQVKAWRWQVKEAFNQPQVGITWGS